MKLGTRLSSQCAVMMVLFGIASTGANANDLAGGSRAPGGGPEESRPVLEHQIDFRLSVGAGAFLYMQYVDGGYYIDGYPYDLNWYGLTGEAVGIIEIAVPALKGIGIGIGGCLHYAVNPAAANDDSKFMVRADSGALGGYGGVSASYCFDDWRLNAIAGYGGIGVASYYGGSGPAVAFGVDYPLMKGTVRMGIGARYLVMYLYHPGSDFVGSEQGPYLGFSVSAVVDWIP